jgi:hypothetical protein
LFQAKVCGMSPNTAFLAVITVAIVVCLGIVAYVRMHLRSLLVELCGSRERASFWLAFSNVTLVLVPLIFGLHYTPDLHSGQSILFNMAAQLEYVLVGFVATFTLLAIIVSRFIPREAGVPRPLR